ncbi:MAG: SRPBCC family protein [Pseudonocardia sp.]
MPTAFTAETTVGRPVGEVWERLVDWDTAERWMPGVEAVRAQGPLTAGSTLVFTARGKERLATIAALEPGRRITVRSVQGGVTADYAYECVAHGCGTVVSLVADCSMTGPVRLLGPVIRFAIRRADGGQLAAFAATFASSPAA